MVSDQTEEMNKFVEQLRLEGEIIKGFEKLSLRRGSDLSSDQLKSVIRKINEITAIIHTERD